MIVAGGVGGLGAGGSLDRELPQACHAVSLRRGASFAKVVVPRRRPEDLVLPAELHRRVLEVAPRYFSPVLLTDPDGRVSRFPRCLARFTDSSGRRGFGWIEWNQPQRS